MPDTVRFTELKSFFEEVVKAGKIGIWGRVIGVIFRLGRRFGSLEFLSFFVSVACRFKIMINVFIIANITRQFRLFHFSMERTQDRLLNVFPAFRVDRVCNVCMHFLLAIGVASHAPKLCEFASALVAETGTELVFPEHLWQRSINFLLGIATNQPRVPSMIFKSRMTKALSKVMEQKA